MNMLSVIEPKSDQINADDLLGASRTITIADVQIKGGQEQPVSIYFEGSDKAFRPCKSMSRVLVAGWGADAKQYVGRSLTLYRDPTVKWGGMEVGGIRISHMSHIDKALVLALTATKGSRKMTTIHPLKVEASGIAAAREAIESAPDMAALAVVWKSKAMAPFRGELQGALDARKAALDPTVFEGPDDTQRGEAHSDDAIDLIAMFQTAGDDTAFNSAKKSLEAMRGSLSADDLTAVERAREDAAERVLS